jgi:hypothetical protein
MLTNIRCEKIDEVLSVVCDLNEKGRKRLSSATDARVLKHGEDKLAFVLDDVVLACVVVSGQVDSHLVIYGYWPKYNCRLYSCRLLERVLRTGPMPAALVPIE